MKSLEFGPGLEKAKLEPNVRHAIRCVGDCRWGEAIVPPEEVNEGAYAQLDDVFGNNGADLRTRKQGVSASSTGESSSNGSKCTQEIQKKAGFGKARQRATASMLRRCGREAAAIVAGFALTLRSLTDPASSMVKPACIRNTSIAALLMD